MQFILLYGLGLSCSIITMPQQIYSLSVLSIIYLFRVLDYIGCYMFWVTNFFLLSWQYLIWVKLIWLVDSNELIVRFHTDMQHLLIINKFWNKEENLETPNIKHKSRKDLLTPFVWLTFSMCLCRISKINFISSHKKLEYLFKQICNNDANIINNWLKAFL